jgi:hypothetical protein
VILDASATVCPSPQVQTSIEKHWDNFHAVPAANNTSTKMPLDAPLLILGASYNAYGNADLLQHVDLATKVRIPVCRSTRGRARERRVRVAVLC